MMKIEMITELDKGIYQSDRDAWSVPEEMADYIANDYVLESADQGLVVLVGEQDRITLKRQIDGVLVTTQDIAK